MKNAKLTDKEKTQILTDKWASTRVHVFFQTSMMVVLGTALLAGLGYLLDSALNTFPIFFIIGVVVAFPTVQLALYRKFKNIANDNLKQ